VATQEVLPDISFYEVFPTPVFDGAVEELRAHGYLVRRNFQPDTFHIVFAHVAVNAWNDVLARSHPGAICVRVSSEERPVVAAPRHTERGVIALDLVPRVADMTGAWDQVCSVLAKPLSLDAILSGRGSPFFSILRPPQLLLMLWLRCAAFLLDGPNEHGNAWRERTLHSLARAVESGQHIKARALQELEEFRCNGNDARSIQCLLDALERGDQIGAEQVRTAASLLTDVLNGPAAPRVAAKSAGQATRR
jgi:hypothetical protein